MVGKAQPSLTTAVSTLFLSEELPARMVLPIPHRRLFARQDYRSTTTREIAAAAGVTEHLLFRYFGSKAALFREALVLPFTGFVAIPLIAIGIALLGFGVVIRRRTSTT